MKTALVTGGAGFLGSHLCEKLLGAGHSVICVDNFVTGRRANISHLEGRDDFRLIEHDITLPLMLDDEIDYVLHFASPASPIDYLELPIQTLKVGSLGTHIALGLAKAKGARLLLASTSEVYGDPLVHPQPESYWGQRQSGRTEGCLRRGQTFLGSDGHGLSSRPRPRDPHRSDLQHLRSAHASQGRAGGPGVHSAGAHRRAADGLRRRFPDALVLLRRRSDRRDLSFAFERPRRADQHRQPPTR